MMDLSIPYYEDNTRISNSAIGWFLTKGPQYFKKKLDGLVPEEKGSQLERGTMIHEYILQPEEFYKDYLVFDGTTPSSDNQERFCKYLTESTEIEPDKQLLEAYKKSYSIIGKSEDKMLSEAKKIASTLNEYMTAIKENKILISSKEVAKCAEVKSNILNHKAASILLDNPDWEEHHEFHINWEMKDVKCKSLLDCVKFDFKQKKCQLIDLKTTVKLWHFQDSMNTYDYLRQLCFYAMAIYWYLKNERDENPEEWLMEFYIVAIDSTQTSDIRVFKFEDYAVNNRSAAIVKCIDDICWHQYTNQWKHTREYYEGDGCESLEL